MFKKKKDSILTIRIFNLEKELKDLGYTVNGYRNYETGDYITGLKRRVDYLESENKKLKGVLNEIVDEYDGGK